MRSISRAKDVYGRGNRLPVGRTKFFEDFVENDENKFVPGTGDKIPRLKAIPLGERAVGFFDDKIDALLEALGQLHNDPSTKQRPTVKDTPVREHKEKTRRRAA